MKSTPSGARAFSKMLKKARGNRCSRSGQAQHRDYPARHFSNTFADVFADTGFKKFSPGGEAEADNSAAFDKTWRAGQVQEFTGEF
jgi:hypothetical protein